MNLVPIIAVSAFAVWILTAIVFSVLVGRAKTVEQKRERFAKGVVFSGGTFLLFICTAVIAVAEFPAVILFLIIPAIVGIGYLSLRYTYFCPKCLRKIQKPFKTVKFCPFCGTKYDSTR